MAEVRLEGVTKRFKQVTAVEELSFTVQDGGPGDDDGLGNGTITDPSGPLVAAAPVPTLGHAALALLGLLIGGLGVRQRRRAG